VSRLPLGQAAEKGELMKRALCEGFISFVRFHYMNGTRSMRDHARECFGELFVMTAMSARLSRRQTLKLALHVSKKWGDWVDPRIEAGLRELICASKKPAELPRPAGVPAV